MKPTIVTALLALLALLAAPPARAILPPEGEPGFILPFTEGTTGFYLHIPGLEEAVALLSDPQGGAAQATATLSQVLVGNTVVESGVAHGTLIEDSFNDGTGVFQVNQDAGNMNNQANVLSVVFAAGQPLVQVLSISIEEERRDNVVEATDSTYQDRIVDSFNGMTGYAGVNQASGSLNNEANVFVLGLGVALGSDVLVINDVDMDVVRGGEPSPDEPEPPQPDSIVDSFQNFRGVAQCTQATGNENSLYNVLGVSVTVGGAGP